MDNKNLRRAVHYTQQYLKDNDSVRIHKALDLLCEELKEKITNP